MSWKNYDDVCQQLAGIGLDLKGGLEFNKYKRCKVVGGDSEKRGWYKLFEIGDLITGAYGIWSASDPQSFKVEIKKDDRKTLTADQIAAMRAKQEADKKRAEAERQREIETASRKAAHWWRQLQDAGQSGYMKKKGFDASDLFGARVSDKGNLVIPVQDGTGKIYGFQVIYPTKQSGPRQGRDKDFTPAGLAKKAHFFQLGLVQRGGIVLLCEGFATGASLRKATGLPVVVAFDAGNLTPVAIEIHKTHRKDVRILICADDDHHTMVKSGKNPGRDAATTAALAVDGAVVWPAFPGERVAEKSQSDFNDLHVHPDGGLQAVRLQVEEALATAGWVARKTQAVAERRPMGGGAGAATQGGGETTNGRRRAEAIMPLDDIIERFVPLDDGTGKYVFDLWTNKVAFREQMVTLLPAGVRGDDIKRHPVWFERGAFYLDEVGFDPSGNDRGVRLNTWKGWPMRPKEGSCDRLLSLLHYLCSGDANGDEVFEWVLRWMAYPLQNPGAKMSSAIIMHGPQGTGKSTVWQCMAKIYGDYATVLNQRGLEDRFNSDWVDSKLFILAEEVVTRAEMWHIKNELKELITGEWIRVNPKNIAAYRQRNQVNGVFLSNENQPLPLDNDDRRHCVIYTPEALSESEYDEVFLEIERGGVEALYHHLMHLDLGDFHPKKRPPMTEAKQDLIDLSAPPQMRFIKEWKAGEVHLDGPESAALPFCACLGSALFDAYTRWARQSGFPYPGDISKFIGAVAKLPGWSAGKPVSLYENLKSKVFKNRKMVVPGDKDLEAAKKLGGVTLVDRGPTDSKAEWLTECFFKFQDAVEKRS